MPRAVNRGASGEPRRYLRTLGLALLIVCAEGSVERVNTHEAAAGPLVGLGALHRLRHDHPVQVRPEPGRSLPASEAGRLESTDFARYRPSSFDTRLRWQRPAVHAVRVLRDLGVHPAAIGIRQTRVAGRRQRAAQHRRGIRAAVYRRSHQLSGGCVREHVGMLRARSRGSYSARVQKC